MVDYEFYLNDYRGSSISEREFWGFAQRAEDQLNLYKRAYIVETPDDTAEQMAICAMADVIYAISAAQSGTGMIAAASIGSVSVSYGSAAGLDFSRAGQARELYDAASRYLDIYRG